MMSEHTKEPWKTVRRDDEECCNIDAKGSNGWRGDVTIALNIGNGNARRIVACVNACKGIETEILEGAIGFVLPLWEEGSKAVAQRDSLLAALVYVIEDLELRASMKWDEDERDVVDIGNGAYEQAKAAIASVKGGLA